VPIGVNDNSIKLVAYCRDTMKY